MSRQNAADEYVIALAQARATAMDAVFRVIGADWVVWVDSGLDMQRERSMVGTALARRRRNNAATTPKPLAPHTAGGAKATTTKQH